MHGRVGSRVERGTCRRIEGRIYGGFGRWRIRKAIRVHPIEFHCDFRELVSLTSGPTVSVTSRAHILPFLRTCTRIVCAVSYACGKSLIEIFATIRA